jgi:hypothetical protein
MRSSLILVPGYYRRLFKYLLSREEYEDSSQLVFLIVVPELARGGILQLLCSFMDLFFVPALSILLLRYPAAVISSPHPKVSAVILKVISMDFSLDSQSS